MSSLRNAERQRSAGREHKERGQLKSRQKLGLLEKHKDYVLRARDFHRKEKRINALKEKAAFRNPDEYYMGMVNARTENGVHKAAPSKKLEIDMVKTLTDKDIAFLEMKRLQEMRKIEKMQQSLQFIGDAPKGKHTVFVDSRAEAKKFDPAQYFDTEPELVDKPHRRLRRQQLDEPVIVAGPTTVAELAKVEKETIQRYQELRARIERRDKIAKWEAKLDIKRKLMDKGPRPKKVKGKTKDAPAVYKWKRIRQR